MKAVSPVRHPGRKAQPGVAGGGHPALRCLAEHSGCKGSPPSGEEPAALCLQCDMNDCYSRLRKLVPTIPPNKRVSKVEILQHVIDYILDLQLALETHPALLRQQAPPALHAGSCPAGTPRTPLTALNTDPVRGACHRSGERGGAMPWERPGDRRRSGSAGKPRIPEGTGREGAGTRWVPASPHGGYRVIAASPGSTCSRRVCTHGRE
ncbi:hypothetical protein HGM15179_001691 [Zosterops borbonicus]|uniref:DNA-binding protein inhibitor ID-4 n=1 Tax=Zosterops borbonicus TaxID=364589 RepID=A0A8K1GWE8_9PASS|nr:hypothetical protein HGM15179_001691 [Zosterops borbonicus]